MGMPKPGIRHWACAGGGVPKAWARGYGGVNQIRKTDRTGQGICWAEGPIIDIRYPRHCTRRYRSVDTITCIHPSKVLGSI